jgi:hypothetical protein
MATSSAPRIESPAAEATTAKPNISLYLGYGSNLWLNQMRRRCPGSQFLGLGILKDWKLIINQRGYANVIKSAGDLVYGFIFSLSTEDERLLDICEGVPTAYEKLTLECDFIPGESQVDIASTLETDTLKNAEKKVKGTVNALVYVNLNLIKESQSKVEYIHRMNKGINDALAKGVPKEFIDKYLRPFIPPEDGSPLSPELVRSVDRALEGKFDD